eukprot:gene16952-22444_t
MEEEIVKQQSSEYSSRGRIWNSRPSWHLTKASRLNNNKYYTDGIDHILSILRKYDVDPNRGFLPTQDPLQRLPYSKYHIWEDLADDLPKLLCARLGQARDPLRQLPVLPIDKLITDRELRRAHLLLCLFAHAFIWGGPDPLDYIPEGIAKPLVEVSEKLGIPPVLGHPSIVLNNWRRFDLEGDISMENLSTLNNFFDGRDESWFYLITVEIEAKGAAAVVPMMLAIDAIQRYQEEILVNNTISNSNSYYVNRSVRSVDPELSLEDESHQIGLSLRNNNIPINKLTASDDDYFSVDEELIGILSEERVVRYVTKQLSKISTAIQEMCKSLSAMKEGCHPFIFYHRVRPFLSGWKQNPTLPNGVIYQGVNKQRQQYYGGSAAQSSLIPFLDIGLGISHDNTRSKDFLLAMRDYMVSSHRDFLKYLESVACIREFVINTLDSRGLRSSNQIIKENINSTVYNKQIFLELQDAYDSCVMNVKNFRTGHITLVADYILAQQLKNTSNKKTLESAAGGKGTGGTDLMKFLKPVRDNCEESRLQPASPIKETEVASYVKDSGCNYVTMKVADEGKIEIQQIQDRKSKRQYKRVSAAAFAPLSTRVSTKPLQMAFAGGLPGNEGPELKNFDPLKLSEKSPEWVPWFREAELKHGRIAMLATAGYIVADFVKLPGAVHEVSSLDAHTAAVSSGALLQILLWTSLLEIISIPAVVDLDKSDRAPGYFAFDPLGFGKKPEDFKKYQINELKNGRLAMLAFSGIITQAALTGKGFPYF